jgi:hypothetical protein
MRAQSDGIRVTSRHAARACSCPPSTMAKAPPWLVQHAAGERSEERATTSAATAHSQHRAPCLCEQRPRRRCVARSAATRARLSAALCGRTACGRAPPVVARATKASPRAAPARADVLQRLLDLLRHGELRFNVRAAARAPRQPRGARRPRLRSHPQKRIARANLAAVTRRALTRRRSAPRARRSRRRTRSLPRQARMIQRRSSSAASTARMTTSALRRSTSAAFASTRPRRVTR